MDLEKLVNLGKEDDSEYMEADRELLTLLIESRGSKVKIFFNPR